MARNTKYSKGFAAGVAAAVELIRTTADEMRATRQCNMSQFAEWQSVARVVENGKFDTSEPAPSTPAVDEVVPDVNA